MAKEYIQNVDIKKLKPYDRNPRKKVDEALPRVIKSIKKFGYIAPIIVNGNFRICVGHVRYKAAIELGFKKIDVLMDKSLVGKKFIAYNIADNQTNTLTEFDDPILAELAIELRDQGFDISTLGFDEKELEEIMASLDEPITGLTDPDDVPETPKKPISKRGDIWILGEHRLVCGDATSESDVALLMNGQKADMVFTDPPYNIGFKYNSYDDNKTKNEYTKFCQQWINILYKYCDSIIITPGKQNLGTWFNIALIKDYGTWLKKNSKSGGSIFNLLIVEPLLFLGKFKKRRPHDVFEHFVWSGFLRDKAEATTYEDHSCPKPIPLIQDIIDSYSNKNDIILDIFLGSGTTIIASEKLNRRCYAMEIDPVYCDVSIKRWENFTGQKAKLSNRKRRAA